MKYRSPLLLIPLLIFASCDRPDCHNANPVFDHYAPNAQEYKAELVKQMHAIAPGRLSYWIDGFTEYGGIPYLRVHVQGGDLCAKAEFDISRAAGMQHLIRVKAGGYYGAELSHPEYTIDSLGGIYHFALLRSRIID